MYDTNCSGTLGEAEIIEGLLSAGVECVCEYSYGSPISHQSSRASRPTLLFFPGWTRKNAIAIFQQIVPEGEKYISLEVFREWWEVRASL